MNFYASPAYLETISRVYFPGQSTSVSDFEIEGRCFRFLVVNGRRVITNGHFLDYSEPLAADDVKSPTQRKLFIEKCAISSVAIEDWESSDLAQTAKPAPYVDFSGFQSYEEYCDYVGARTSDRFRKNKRLRERLEGDYGELRFTVEDTQADVIDSSLRWKSQQLRDTGFPDIFVKPENWEFFRELKRRNVLRSSTLRAKNRLLSAWLGFVHEGVWSGWIFFTYDHDPALKKYWLGWQLMESILEYCYESGLNGFGFSVGHSDYKFKYGTHVRLLKPFGVKPLSGRVTDLLKDEAKRVLMKFPRIYEGARDVARVARARR